MNIKVLPIILGIIILVLLGILIFVPARNGDDGSQPNATSTPVVATSTGPNDGPVTATSTIHSYTSTKGRTVRVNVAQGQLVRSPLDLRGDVAGFYFEASFPVSLLDANGKLLAQAPAMAEGDWMVATPVPYKATLTFAPPGTATGTLVLHNDNASGLPEHDDEVRIPVRFR